MTIYNYYITNVHIVKNKCMSHQKVAVFLKIQFYNMVAIIIYIMCISENGRYAMNYLLRFLSPLFLMLLGMRLYSLLYVIQRVIKNFGFEVSEFCLI